MQFLVFSFYLLKTFIMPEDKYNEKSHRKKDELECSKKNPTDKGAHVKIYDYSLFFIKFILEKEKIPDFKVLTNSFLQSSLKRFLMYLNPI